jgi:TolB protein
MLFVTFIFAEQPDAVIKVEKDVDQRASITIIAANSVEPKFRKELNRLFKADFSVSGHFLVKEGNVTSVAFSALPIQLGSSSEYTLLYNFAKTPNGGASLDIKLFRGNPKKQILSKNYAVSRLEKSPFLAHKAVSEINKLAKFPAIDWINRYVVLSRYTGAKKTEILLADYTFTYQKTIIKNGFNMFPKWADKEQKVLYYSNYSGKRIKLYKLNIYTGVKSLVTTSTGMLICSDVSRDGSKLLLTMAPNSQPDMYLFSAGTATKLTNFSGIDVGGKFADSEQSVVFVSNRLGTPNVFKMPIGGGSVNKIVHHGTNNASVDAHEGQVVYSSKESRKSYNIYLTDSSGSQTRPLTSGGINQFPRFSRDGNIVMYIKRRSGGNSIGFINISANRSELFNMGISRIQSIDW